MVTGEVSADTGDLGWFVDRGQTYIRVLQDMLSLVSAAQSRTVAACGENGPIPLATTNLQELIDEATVNNGFVDTVRDALEAFTGSDKVIRALEGSTVDWALDQAGLRGTLTGRDLSAGADRILADRVVIDGVATRVANAGSAHERIRGWIDRGDDLGISNGELNNVAAKMEAIGTGELVQVVNNLTDEQFERLFHNVHSSGFWSNDWDDRERTEFYDTLGTLPIESKQRLGAFSPYLEALAMAEEAISGNHSAVKAFDRFSQTPGFREDLSFTEREALLHQAANYPEPEPIRNLGRLSDHQWFQEFDTEDTERSAKMIAFLSQFEGGDQVVINNTLDLFLEADAPYQFDWEQDKTAFGSAGRDAFHFNRLYLDAGEGPVGTGDRTRHMVTHTVAHEVNHLVNGDSVDESYDYFMAEYRAYYVGHLARYGTPPTREEVKGRVEYLLTADSGAYERIADALDDPVEGPRIAAFVTDIVGRPVTAETVAVEISSGITDPTTPAPLPVPVDGGSNILNNSKQDGPQ